MGTGAEEEGTGAMRDSALPAGWEGSTQGTGREGEGEDRRAVAREGGEREVGRGVRLTRLVGVPVNSDGRGRLGLGVFSRRVPVGKG